MLTKLIFIILQTTSMSQFTQDRYIENPIIHPACSNTLRKQQPYVKLFSVISTLQPLSKEGGTGATAPYNPFIVDEVSERYHAKERLESQRDDLFNSIAISEFRIEFIREMDVLDLHLYTRRSGMYDDHINSQSSMEGLLRQLDALDEEYKNTHDEVRKKSIISNLKQLQIEFCHHLTGYLNYERILYAVTSARIYIYKLRSKAKVTAYRKKRNK